MLELEAVVAVDLHWGIGYRGQIPWHLPEDLKRFKRHTMGGVLIMGRKTHDSIGRALPGRRNIVLTRDASRVAIGAGCEAVSSLEELWSELEGELRPCFIIGGEAIYEALLPRIHRVALTVVGGVFEVDVRFPALNPSSWAVRSREEFGADERHTCSFCVLELERRGVQGGAPSQEVPEAWRPHAWSSSSR